MDKEVTFSNIARESFSQKIVSFWQTEMEISIIGLENAGKSTFVNVLNVTS